MYQYASNKFRAAWILPVVCLAASAAAAATKAEEPLDSLPNSSFYVLRSDSGTHLTCGRQKLADLRSLRAARAVDREVSPSAPSIRYTTASGEFIVDFTGFSPDAQTAFEFAVDLLSDTLDLDIPVHVDAVFEPLGSQTLGAAGPTVVFALSSPAIGTLFFPSSLADQLTGEDQLGPGQADIESSFASNEPNWYFGTDANPGPGQFDFVTVVLHELIHGLGFIDSFDIDEMNPAQGTFGIGDMLTPIVFDFFLATEGVFIVDDFPNPSAQILSAMTGDDLLFAGSETIAANGGTAPNLYAPPVFELGASIGHWDDDSFPPGNPNSLMTPFVGAGESNHNLGPNTVGLLNDIGYDAELSLSQSLSIPQFGDGGILRSEIVVVNLSGSQSVQGNVNFFDPDGNPLLAESLVSGGTAFDLPALGSQTFSTAGTAPDVTTGSAVVTSNSPVSAVIRFDISGTGVAGVGSAPLLTRAIAPVRRQGSLSTGVAFRNTSGTPINVTLTLKDENGNVVPNGTTVEPVPIDGRVARFIEEFFPQANTANFRGSLCLDSDSGSFAAIALELEVGRVFTTLPVAAPQN